MIGFLVEKSQLQQLLKRIDSGEFYDLSLSQFSEKLVLSCTKESSGKRTDYNYLYFLGSSELEESVCSDTRLFSLTDKYGYLTIMNVVDKEKCNIETIDKGVLEPLAKKFFCLSNLSGNHIFGMMKKCQDTVVSGFSRRLEIGDTAYPISVERTHSGGAEVFSPGIGMVGSFLNQTPEETKNDIYEWKYHYNTYWPNKSHVRRLVYYRIISKDRKIAEHTVTSPLNPLRYNERQGSGS